MRRTPRSYLRRAAWLAGLFAWIGASACQVQPSEVADAPAEDSSAQAEQVLIGGVQWYVDYGAAQAAARAQDKALWVHFGENPG